jgi:hypothetical protein
VVREVEDTCRRMNLSSIMSFCCDWNEEVIAQFYATLYVNCSTKTFYCKIQGKPFPVDMHSLQAFLGSLMLISWERRYMRRKMC